MQYRLHELLRQRWIPRAFDERPVEMDKLWSLFEAARWAPSCFNAQPWRFILATKENPAEYNQLFDCLVKGNKKWAHQAPVLVLSVAKLTFEDGSANRHAWHDVGLAVGSLVVQAVALGLIANQMAGFDMSKTKTDLGIPNGYDPVAMIAIGYARDRASLPDKLLQKEVGPRNRKPLAESVFHGNWGIPFTLD
jgi:nitroreductase